MNNQRKTKRISDGIETQIVEDNRVLSAYAYCSLPTHFFDRALAQMNSDKASGLTMSRWGQKGLNSRLPRQ